MMEWLERSDGSYVPSLLSPLGIKDKSTFLDLGCGSGYVNAYLASRHTLRHNLGLELEMETIRLAQRLNDNVKSISWICASAEAIPLQGATVDHTVCRAVLPYVVVSRVVAEIARILRPGGTVVFLLHSWTFYLRWLSLYPPNWKRSLSGLLHFFLGIWFNLTGRQIRIRLGGNLLGQTFQTEFRMRKLFKKYGIKLYKAVHGPEFLIYAAKCDE